MTLSGLGVQVESPVYVGDAADGQFFKGQPGWVKENIGQTATFDMFAATDEASHHIHIGTAVIMNQRVLDWSQGVVSK